MDAGEATAVTTAAPLLGSLAALTKQRQTALLLLTGAGAYALTIPGGIRWPELASGVIALWLSISGCTALNMVLDRDIDAKMARTAGRPLPMGDVTVPAAIAFGLALSLSGLALAWTLGGVFGAVVTVGFGVDLLVYTAWLKRRTPLSILFGGVSGGMPALAGRALALGRIDVVGVLLALGVLLWIPAHILTLAMRRADEYRAAGIPAWPCVYGATRTRRLIASSTVAGTVTLLLAGIVLGIAAPALAAVAILGCALSILAVGGLFRPSERHDRLLFKAASVYMAGAFGCLVAGAALGSAL